MYLSLDATLQMAIYDLLEQELAGILNSKIINAKTSESSELYIPIYKVYNALIENSVISTSAMANAPDGTEQATVYRTFSDRKEAVLSEISGILQSDTAYNDLSEEMQEMVTYVVKCCRTSRCLSHRPLTRQIRYIKTGKMARFLCRNICGMPLMLPGSILQHLI